MRRIRTSSAGGPFLQDRGAERRLALQRGGWPVPSDRGVSRASAGGRAQAPSGLRLRHRWAGAEVPSWRRRLAGRHGPVQAGPAERHQGERTGPPNKRMQLTKLRAAPVLQAEVPPCAPAGRTDGGTASQLIPGVRWTSGVEHATAWPGTTPPDKSGSPAAEQRAYLDCASQESSRSTCEKPAVHRQEAAAHELFRQLGHEGHPSRACS